MKFDSVTDARRWYEFVTYSTADDLRGQPADFNVIIADGFAVPETDDQRDYLQLDPDGDCVKRTFNCNMRKAHLT